MGRACLFTRCHDLNYLFGRSPTRLLLKELLHFSHISAQPLCLMKMCLPAPTESTADPSSVTPHLVICKICRSLTLVPLFLHDDGFFGNMKGRMDYNELTCHWRNIEIKTQHSLVRQLADGWNTQLRLANTGDTLNNYSTTRSLQISGITEKSGCRSYFNPDPTKTRLLSGR